jgi:glycosyltransferase involved in cell wall biosynthesis
MSSEPCASSEMLHRPPPLDELGDRAVSFVRYWGSHFKTLRHVHGIAAEFQPIIARGWSCHLVLERNPEDSGWLAPLLNLGVKIHLEPRPRGKYDARCIFRVTRLCRRLQATIFVCHNIHMSPLLGAAAARVPVRIWIKESMNSCYEESRQPDWKERIGFSTRLSSYLATQVIAVSGSVKCELIELGVPDRKVIVRLNPRRLGASARVRDRSSVRQSYGYSEQEVVITTVGHAVPVKGWDLLVRAFQRIHSADSRTRLLLIGGFERPEEQEFYKQLQTQLADTGLKSKVLFAGHVENVAELLGAADLFVMPSRSEGCANALIEGLEAGLPCVATKVGSAEQVIVPGVNGFLVNRGDEIVVAQALQELTRDNELRRSFARAARVPDCIPTLSQYAEGLADDYAAFHAIRASAWKRRRSEQSER